MALPFAQLFPALLNLGQRQVIPVSRRNAGTFVNGVRQYLSATVLNLDAIIEPAGNKELMMLPELERTKEYVTVFTESSLQSSDVNNQTEADTFTWSGRTWRVIKSSDWTAQAGYAQSLAVRVGV